MTNASTSIIGGLVITLCYAALLWTDSIFHGPVPSLLRAVLCLAIISLVAAYITIITEFFSDGKKEVKAAILAPLYTARDGLVALIGVLTIVCIDICWLETGTFINGVEYWGVQLLLGVVTTLFLLSFASYLLSRQVRRCYPAVVAWEL